MKLVVIESPYAGDADENVRYLRACIRDCLLRGEAPIASHGLYTQSGVLDDGIPEERRLGMEAGWQWMRAADAVVVYTDRGVSDGMRGGIEHAIGLGVQTEFRRLEGWS